MNLTHEVRNGILTHTGEQEPESLEGRIVRIVDRVAYINHDIDDAIRYGILEEGDLPRDEIAILGPSGSKRIDTLVHDLVETSAREGDIAQSDEVGAAMLSLRAFMFERVYLGPETRVEHERARETVRRIFDGSPTVATPPDEITEFIAGHDRPVRARIRCEPLMAAGSRTPPSRRFARAPTSSRSSRSARRSARRARGSSGAARSTTSAPRASPSTPSTSSSTATAATRAAT